MGGKKERGRCERGVRRDVEGLLKGMLKGSGRMGGIGATDTSLQWRPMTAARSAPTVANAVVRSHADWTSQAVGT